MKIYKMFLMIKFPILAIFFLLMLNTSYAKEIAIREYCNYKQSAGSLTINLPLNVKYQDGFQQKTQLFISCMYGYKCSGFYSGGEPFNSRVFEELKVKHMGRDSVTLMDGMWDEFLLDIKNKNFRWTQGNSGIITEHKCIKILTE